MVIEKKIHDEFGDFMNSDELIDQKIDDRMKILYEENSEQFTSLKKDLKEWLGMLFTKYLEQKGFKKYSKSPHKNSQF